MELVSPEPSVFSTAAQIRKDYNIENHNFACASVWV
jgi:hypothetical protein